MSTESWEAVARTLHQENAALTERLEAANREITRLHESFLAENEQLGSLRARLAGIGTVYVPPEDWDYPGMGEPPPIEAYERIDLTDLCR